MMFTFTISFSLLLFSVFAGGILCSDDSDASADWKNSLTSLGTSNDTGRMTTFRLPNNTVPTSYALHLVPHLSGDFGFDGEVIISIRVKQSSKTIYLHSKNLAIKSAQIYKEGRKLFPSVTLDAANQLLKVESQIDLEENANYSVSIEFNGTLNVDMVGFYRSSYKIGNTTEWLATTHFEPTFARTAFPCYDEPGYRTPFNVHVARYQNQKAISNMPVLWTSPPDRNLDNRVWDTFMTTPEMPTYLVAFVVSQYSHVSDAAKYVSVYTRRNAIDYAKYALATGTIMLKQMEQYTDIRYSLPKMDLVAIPDFLAGAMENWGLTTYRERNIIYNENMNSARSKQIIAQVIAHEISHQWFGDYVTPVWWDYVWLNEAFATYFETYTVSQVEPTWRSDEYFVADILQKALFVDEAGYYHALTWPVKTIEEIDSLFDIITYNKGASILRMLEHMVSTSIFRDSLKAYLKKGKEIGGSVTPDILWNAFDQNKNLKKAQLPNNVTVRTIMKTWTENRGYPLITVRRIPNGNLTNIGIKQQTYNSTRGDGTTPNTEWIVPLSFMKRSSTFPSTKPAIWSTSQKEITLDNVTATDEWILFNINQTGYYRVNYDRENWQLLVEQMRTNFRLIPPLNRAQLIDDAFSLAVDEKLTFKTPFALLMYLNYEDDPIPILTTLKNLIYLRSTYGSSSYSNVSAELQHYMIERIDPHFRKIGFTVQSDDTDVVRTLRMRIVQFACELEINTCVKNATDEFDKNVKNLTNIHPDLREIVLCTALKTDLREETWNRIWVLYRESDVPQIKQTVITATGCSKNSTLLKRYLNQLLVFNETKTDVRFGDLKHAFSAIFSTPLGVSTGLDILVDLMPSTMNLTDDNSKKLQIFVENIKSQITTPDDLKKLNLILLALKKLKQERFFKLVTLLENVERRVNETFMYHTKTVEHMISALKSLPNVPTIEPDQPTSTSTSTPIPAGSSATILMPSTFVSVLTYASLYVYGRRNS